MCPSCQEIAAGNLARTKEAAERKKNGRGGNRHRSHTNKTPPHCEYPETCTCRHRPVADGYVNRDGVA